MHTLDYQHIDTLKKKLFSKSFHLYFNYQNNVQPFYYIFIYMIYSSSGDQPLIIIKR